MGESAADATWYFAYGSNLNPTILCGRRGMRPLAEKTAHLDGYRLCFNLPVGGGERGVANVEPDPASRTWGVAYLITPEEFGRLDGTEGVPLGIYRRVPAEIRTCCGETLSAFTYRSWLTREGRKPSLRYMGLLIEGAIRHSLPSDYIRFLKSFELAVDERQATPPIAERAARPVRTEER